MTEITTPSAIVGLTFIIGVLVGLCIGLGYCAHILYQDTKNLRRRGNQLRMINAHLKRKGQRVATAEQEQPHE